MNLVDRLGEVLHANLRVRFLLLWILKSAASL